MASGPEQFVLVDSSRLRSFSEAVLGAAGLPAEESAVVADSLVRANLRGVDSHGVMRLPAYVERFSKIWMEPVRVVREGPATAVVDGGNRPGQVAAAFAMTLALGKARQTGLGMVAVRRSNHFGAAAYFSMMAASQGCIGFAAANASPRIAPWGGRTPLLGNNPSSIAVPFRPGFPLVVDMALSVVAAGKIRQLAARGEPLPPGWGLDREGRPTRDARAALEGLLMPVGGHKGVAMSLAVDWLAAGLSEGAFAHEVIPVDETAHPQDVSLVCAAIEIQAFVDIATFTARLEEQAERYKGSAKTEEAAELVLPGEVEHRTEADRTRRGVPLGPQVVERLNACAGTLGCRERLPRELVTGP